MSYGFDLSKIPLDDFAELMKSGYLIPSMRPLLNNLDDHFALIKSHGLSTVADLYKQTKTKAKAEALAKEIGLDVDYMIVLRRLVSSYIVKPRKIEEYPDIDDRLVDKLMSLGIKKSVDLYEYLRRQDDEETKLVLDIEDDLLSCIKAMLEVSQLRYVSPLFATVMVRSGFDSIEKIAASEPKAFHKKIVATNKEQDIYKGNVGDSDAQFLIDDAKVFLRFQ